MSQVLVLYHSKDLDGMCSGAVVRFYYEGQGNAVTLYPIDYGDRVPFELVNEDTEAVVMVDFSLKPDPFLEMFRLTQKYEAELIWLDHHKKALEEAAEALHIIIPPADEQLNFDSIDSDDKALKGLQVVGTAGCELAWKYYFPKLEMPKIVNYLGRYDVWDKTDLEKWDQLYIPFQWGMRAMDTDPRKEQDYMSWIYAFVDTDGKFEAETIPKLLRDGEAIGPYQDKNNEYMLLQYGFEATMDDPFGTYANGILPYRFFALNTGMKSSISFKAIENDYDIFIAYIHEGKDFSVSLYAINAPIDVSDICQKLGGGGHPKAAGFRCTELPFYPKVEMRNVEA